MLMSKCHYSLATAYFSDAYLSGSIDCDTLIWTDDPLLSRIGKGCRHFCCCPYNQDYYFSLAECPVRQFNEQNINNDSTLSF